MSPLPTLFNRRGADQCQSQVWTDLQVLTGNVCPSVWSTRKCVARLGNLRRLAVSKDKDCDRQPRPCDESKYVNWGRLAQMLRECVPPMLCRLTELS